MVDKELDIVKCPFCDHPTFSSKGKCPSCRHKLISSYFEEVFCPSCNEKTKIKNGKCTKCDNKISIPDFEMGKYLDIPKRRRVNLVSEREELIYERMKKEHFGVDSEIAMKMIVDNANTAKRNFTLVLLLTSVTFFVFAIIAFLTKAFKLNKVSSIQNIKFIMPLHIWFCIKSVVFVGLYFVSKSKPILTYLISFTILILLFMIENLTLPKIPLSYIISHICIFIIMVFGVKYALNFEDYKMHYF